MSWKEILKEEAEESTSNPHDKAIERLKEIIDNNAEFELKGNEVIIKPSWLDNNKNWEENIGLDLGTKYFAHYSPPRETTAPGMSIETRIPITKRYIDYFSFPMPDKDHNDYDRMIYTYVHFHYDFKGKEYNDYDSLYLYYPNDSRAIPDYYASFLLATKDKNKFRNLWLGKGLISDL